MKLYSPVNFINLFLLFVIISCNPQTEKNNVHEDRDSIVNSFGAYEAEPDAVSVALPVIDFNEETYDFGNIEPGEKVSYAFLFKNTGSSDLIIKSAQGSCGCTVPSFPKEPIKPGATDSVIVIFNSEGKSGMVEKTVTLVTNCKPSTKILTIVAKIAATEK